MTHVGNNDLPGVRFAAHMVGFNKYIYIYLNVTESWYMGDRARRVKKNHEIARWLGHGSITFSYTGCHGRLKLIRNDKMWNTSAKNCINEM